MNHMRSFHSDNPKARTKAKEYNVFQFLEKNGQAFDYQVYIPFRACNLKSETTCAYVDFVIYKAWGILILEVDEDQHKHYGPMCDVRRDFDIASSIMLESTQKIVIIRYNPDCFRVGNHTISITKKEREQKLLDVVLNIKEPESFERLFLFYDKDSSVASLPSVSKEWNCEAVLEVSRLV